jgi:inhibitor of cysteine peptidase
MNDYLSMNQSDASLKQKVIAGVIAILFILGLVVVVSTYKKVLPKVTDIVNSNNRGNGYSYVQFKSDEEYRAYIEKGIQIAQESNMSDLTSLRNDMPAIGFSGPGGLLRNAQPNSGDKRVSSTNVQIVGIDEPDIVKTNGKSIYYSPDTYGGIIRPLIAEDRIIGIPPVFEPTKGKVINAVPVTELGETSTFDISGEMLLLGPTLIVFSGQTIIAYDVTDSASTKELWRQTLSDGVSYTTARLFDDEIYLVTQTYNYQNSPCPIPFIEGSTSISIACTDIWYPTVPVTSDSTVTVSRIVPTSGEVKDTISFVSQSGSSIVSMSENAIYVATPIQKDYSIVALDTLRNVIMPMLPLSLQQQAEKIVSYDISDQSKLTEIQSIYSKHLATLTSDEKLQFETDANNATQNYLKSQIRSMSQTSIAKIDNNSLDIVANGTVPGVPLNQFSLDEYDSNLRIATTVGGGWFGFGGDQVESQNELYVLNSNLEKIGEITGLGIDERIYSVRFIGSKGYMVTFKQIDPFYVLDLSDPRSPKVTGELKIPGFSSYLHPVSETRVLGVGRDASGMVKLSLFDVSDVTSPRETSVYSLNEYWSEALDNHRAFLQDDKYKVIFIPGGNGGYVIGYDADQLTLKKVVSDIQAKRALFINDNLYVVGADGIKVFDESTWSVVGELAY